MCLLQLTTKLQIAICEKLEKPLEADSAACADLFSSASPHAVATGWSAQECDQMAILFVQYQAICHNENLHNSINSLPKQVEKFAKCKISPCKSVCLRLFRFAKVALAKFCQIWSHCYDVSFSHYATLYVGTLIPRNS